MSGDGINDVKAKACDILMDSRLAQKAKDPKKAEAIMSKLHMAVPKKRTTSSKRNMRRSHHAIKSINVVVNKVTGEYQLPHHISLVDGFYKGKKVILEKEVEASENENL